MKAIKTPNISYPLIPGSGVIQICDPQNPMIQFEDVPLLTPNGDLLINSINFTIKLGQNVIITGKPNIKIHENWKITILFFRSKWFWKVVTFSIIRRPLAFIWGSSGKASQ